MESKVSIANFGAFIIMLLCFSSVALSTSVSVNQDEFSCVYTVFVRTSKAFHAGTDSNITLALYDGSGYGVRIKNLEAWGGAMEKGHDYFERGNLDIFTGRGPCLSGTVCAMNLTSDGTGSHPDWYCNYVEVTTTGPQTKCAQTTFTVEKWLKSDQLSAFIDTCSTGGLNRRLANKLSPLNTLLTIPISEI